MDPITGIAITGVGAGFCWLFYRLGVADGRVRRDQEDVKAADVEGAIADARRYQAHIDAARVRSCLARIVKAADTNPHQPVGHVIEHVTPNARHLAMAREGGRAGT